METQNKIIKQIRKEIKESKKPYVLKKDNMLFIVYKNRVEQYDLKRVETKKQIDKENGDAGYLFEGIYGKGWNREHEAQILKNSGFKQVGLK